MQPPGDGCGRILVRFKYHTFVEKEKKEQFIEEQE
jgi:hypothetical protein